MERSDIKVQASGGGQFDCYVVTPDAAGQGSRGGIGISGARR